jgi:hypothetical protein
VDKQTYKQLALTPERICPKSQTVATNKNVVLLRQRNNHQHKNKSQEARHNPKRKKEKNL